jgi:predicted enzyme related to lactoylglutathione lyase
MPRPIHFEIHADDPARAQRFYERVFGWRFAKWGLLDYWAITTGEPSEPGINGGLVPRRGPSPSESNPVSAFPCTIDVPAIDEFIHKVEAAGGCVVVAKMAVPTIGWLVYCRDTESNVFGMMQTDSAAQ